MNRRLPADILGFTKLRRQIGPLFEDGDAAGKEALPEQAPRERDSGPRSDAAVIKSQVGVLATYNFPPPLSDAELQLWADEIKAMLITLKERAAALDEREADINDQRETLITQVKVLAKMRQDLDQRKREILLLEQEQRSDEQAESELEEATLQATSQQFVSGDPEDLVGRLLQFTPREAGVVLRFLKKSRAAELLNALPDTSWKEYSQAYGRPASTS